MTHQQEIPIAAKGHGHMQDLTEQVAAVVHSSGIKNGLVHEQAWHDGNGHSHLQATVLGPSLTVPVAQGKLVLGTWQQIFHLECDVRARQRTVMVTVIGD